jgi:hypothetical protein
MASPYAKLSGQALWAEGSDFRTLTREEQRVYFVLVTQPNISHCGVLPCNPRRWSRLAADETMESLEATLDLLAAKRYIVIDADSDELWVRTWMKWDGMIMMGNGGKAVARAIDSVLSASLASEARAAALTLAKDRDRGLFEAASQPASNPVVDGPRTPLSRGTATATTTVDNNSSRPVVTDDFDAAIAAAVDIRRGQSKKITRPDSWEKATRDGLIQDFGLSIRAWLDYGVNANDAARHALDHAEVPTTGQLRPVTPAHPGTCECGGTGRVLVDPNDESRTAPVKPCPRTEWPDATVLQLRATS